MTAVQACKLARGWATLAAASRQAPATDWELNLYLKRNGARWQRTRSKAIEAYRKTYALQSKRVKRKGTAA